MSSVPQASTLFPSNFESLPSVFDFSNGTVHVMKPPGREVACVLWDQNSLHYRGAEIVINIMKSSLRYVLLFIFCSIYKHVDRCVSILGIHTHLIKKIWFLYQVFMLLYKKESLKSSAAKCDFVVYRKTGFVILRLPKMKSFPQLWKFLWSSVLNPFPVRDSWNAFHHCLMSFLWVMEIVSWERQSPLGSHQCTLIAFFI